MWKTFTGGTSGAAPVAGNNSGTTSMVRSPGGWHPTILYLAGLIALEIFVMGILLSVVG